MIDIANHAVDQWHGRIDSQVSFADAREAIQRLWSAASVYYDTWEKTVLRAQYKCQWVYLVVEDDMIRTVMTDAEIRQHGSVRIANQSHVQQRVQQHQRRAQRREPTHTLRKRS